MKGHAIAEKRWTDPFHGRRAKFRCTCSWSAEGPANDVITDAKRHLQNVEAKRLASTIQPNKEKS